MASPRGVDHEARRPIARIGAQVGARGHALPVAAEGRLAAVEADDLSAQLTRLLQTKKLYRENCLTLQLLAERIGCPATHVTQALNETLQKSFYEFVNGYRMTEAEALLASPEHTETPIIDNALCGLQQQDVVLQSIQDGTSSVLRQAAGRIGRNRLASMVSASRHILLIY